MKKFGFILSLLAFILVPSAFADGNFTASSVAWNCTTRVLTYTATGISSPPSSLAALWISPTGTYTTNLTGGTGSAGSLDPFSDPFTKSDTMNSNSYVLVSGTYYMAFTDYSGNWFSQALTYPTNFTLSGCGSSIPSADSSVLGATTDTVSGLQGALITRLRLLIPIGAVLLISIAVLFFVLRKFRKIVRN